MALQGQRKALERELAAAVLISPGGGLPAGLTTGRAVSKRIARDAGVRWVLS